MREGHKYESMERNYINVETRTWGSAEEKKKKKKKHVRFVLREIDVKRSRGN